jgi:hypothetical protein
MRFMVAHLQGPAYSLDATDQRAAASTDQMHAPGRGESDRPNVAAGENARPRRRLPMDKEVHYGPSPDVEVVANWLTVNGATFTRLSEHPQFSRWMP